METGVREEFEKAYLALYKDFPYDSMKPTHVPKAVTWAAKWMAVYLKRPDIVKELE